MLDTFTLLIVATLTSLVATAVLAVVWRLNPSVGGVRQWATGLGLVSVGLFLISARDMGVPLLMSVVLGNALIFTGYYVSWTGNLAFLSLEYPKRQAFFYIVLTIFSTIMTYYTAIDNNIIVRFLFTSLFIVFFDILNILTFWPRDKDTRYLAAGILLAGYGLHALVFSVRGLWSFWVLMGNDPTGLGLVANLTYLMALGGVVIISMGFLAITTECLMKRVQALADQDPLTGIHNRRAFFTIAAHIWKRRDRDEETVAVLVLDLDHFKTVNDTHGHAIGDAALRHVVRLATAVLRGDDLMARFGGEEFVILLSDTTVGDARAVAERIRQVVASSPLPLPDGTLLRVTGSLGLATTVPGDWQQTIDQLIDRADQALYRAKAQGRNRVCVADGLAPSRDGCQGEGRLGDGRQAV